MVILSSKQTNEVVLIYHTYNDILQVNPIELEHNNAYVIDSFPTAQVPQGKSIVWYHDGTDLSYKFVDLPVPEPTAEEKIASLETQLTDTQVALAEIYETMLGGQV